jgi:hypothetical protein
MSYQNVCGVAADNVERPSITPDGIFLKRVEESNNGVMGCHMATVRLTYQHLDESSAARRVLQAESHTYPSPQLLSGL